MRPSMKPTKDCPLCGERMRRKEWEETAWVPGTVEAKQSRVSEWVCPDCDYFEEIEEDDEAGS